MLAGLRTTDDPGIHHPNRFVLSIHPTPRRHSRANRAWVGYAILVVALGLLGRFVHARKFASRRPASHNFSPPRRGGARSHAFRASIARSLLSPRFRRPA